MTAQWTPGPWHVETRDFPNRAPVLKAQAIVGSDGHTITEGAWGSTWTQSDANARLIAAAPEMADMIARLETGLADMRRRGVIDESDDSQWLDAVITNARAVLARINGEG